jgi:hypothetical protein
LGQIWGESPSFPAINLLFGRSVKKLEKARNPVKMPIKQAWSAFEFGAGDENRTYSISALTH